MVPHALWARDEIAVRHLEVEDGSGLRETVLVVASAGPDISMAAF